MQPRPASTRTGCSRGGPAGANVPEASISRLVCPDVSWAMLLDTTSNDRTVTRRLHKVNLEIIVLLRAYALTWCRLTARNSPAKRGDAVERSKIGDGGWMMQGGGSFRRRAAAGYADLLGCLISRGGARFRPRLSEGNVRRCCRKCHVSPPHPRRRPIRWLP